MTPAPRRASRHALLLLVCLGSLTHFVRLASPREVVFDEVTMGQYVRAYCCTGERVLDMHPPHAKLLIGAAARLGGFDGSFAFEKIGTPYGDTPIFALRLVPALAGILIPPLFLLLLIELGASFPIALLGGLMLALDNALLLETRIIVWDGILVASILRIAGVLFLRAAHAGPRRLAPDSRRSSRRPGGRHEAHRPRRAGVDAGLSRPRPRRRPRRDPCAGHAGGLIIAGLAFAVYAAGWVAHWMLLTQPGPGDAFYQTTGRMMDDISRRARRDGP